MDSVNSMTVRNRVVLSLRPDAQRFLAERWETRPLEVGTVLYESDAPFTHAIFPHSGVLSLLAGSGDHPAFEKASIGNEGFVGFTYIMGGQGALSRTVVQVAGHASWLPIEDLDAAMARFECVRATILSYSKALIVQLMETVRCNGQHSAEQRVCHWLLHADDRVGGGEFLLTQEALANALGVRRATISESCSHLMRTGAIAYSRGVIRILDRARLRAAACECYDRIVAASLPPA